MSHFQLFDTLEDHAILGVDPGKVTGVALWAPSVDHRRILASAELVQDEIAPWVTHNLRQLSQVHIHLCMIAVENFQQAKGGQPLSSQPHALRVIGIMRALADEWRCSFTTNQPSASKKLAHNDRMRRIGWYKHTKDGHETDARRQVLITVSRFHRDLFRDIIKEEQEDDDATR